MVVIILILGFNEMVRRFWVHVCNLHQLTSHCFFFCQTFPKRFPFVQAVRLQIPQTLRSEVWRKTANKVDIHCVCFVQDYTCQFSWQSALASNTHQSPHIPEWTNVKHCDWWLSHLGMNILTHFPGIHLQNRFPTKLKRMNLF
eukprot:Blabericola_migrator_1__3472@NODE_2027_length_3390_cov_503_443274_g1288_i0_p2_GENE_NODE_2027_length_3390_cov_503_443274_g1288_i0NODE_2027_length_3390_cov_503_443274_g1288_i0_p2_ORF_typecomplete_len143_score3_83ASFV_360/PF01671_16/0_017Pterin_4a/PF01329_19/3e02Pterin_4a/PF01329_19/0_24_NODE_2027_length_3390_cov_503_443274_g1288_i0378806